LTPYGGQSDDEDLPEGWQRPPSSYRYRRHGEFALSIESRCGVTPGDMDARLVERLSRRRL